MAEDRANDPRRRFPNSASHTVNKYKVTQPNAQVGWSTERATLHHDGSHVSVPGPAKLAAKGKAGAVSKILGALKEASR